MIRLLNGYIELTAKEVIKYCETTIEHIEETQKFDNQEFLDWAIPYFNRTACRKKGWQFWRPKSFKDKNKFLKWFYKKHGGPDNNWGCSDSYPVKAKAFARVSKGFTNSEYFFNDWYPSDYGRVSLGVCKRLLPEVEKISWSKILISLEDFKAITKGIK